ncbi:MAG: efflux RND transporter periplasmic adaptor subunit [Pseudohongiellaceae bacterium]
MNSALNRSDAPAPIHPQGHKRRNWLVLTTFGIAALAALSIIAFTDSGSAATEGPASPVAAPPVPALTVTSTTPREVTWPILLNASGSVTAWQDASVGAQIGGYQLTEVLVDVGDHVSQGQVLARFDPALLQAEEAVLLANYEQAEANHQRALELQSRGAISDQDALQSITLARTAAASLEGKRLQLRYTNVVAPDDGTISSRTATLGAVVPTGQELFRLIRQDRLEWRGELTAMQLAQVRIGQEVTLQLPDGTTAAATIRQTSPTLDETTRLAIVYADVDQGSNARAGMYAEGRIELEQSSALVVPAQSVIIRDGRSHVPTLAEEGEVSTITLRQVTVGRRVGEEIEITEGLDARQRVVVQGAGFLNDGDVVRVVRGQQ